MKKKFQKGNIIIAFMAIMSLLNALGLMYFAKISQRQKALSNSQTIDRLEELTKSSFAILESALKRRMWEAPPNATCRKDSPFHTQFSIQNPGDPLPINVRVTGQYDSVTKYTTMVATGTLGTRTVNYKKSIRIIDTSDYLILSKNPNDILIFHHTPSATSVQSGIIAGQKRIYFEGPVKFTAHNHDQTYATSVYGTATKNYPKGFPMIMQAERIQLLGGLKYNVRDSYRPSDSEPTLQAEIDPLITGPLPRKWIGYVVSPLLILEDFTKAQQIKSDYELGTSFQSKASVRIHAYPISLTNPGTFPIDPLASSDNGSYISDPDLWHSLHFDIENLGLPYPADYTCASSDSEKTCSDSNLFPNGFDAWRTASGLDSILQTSDSTPLNFEPLNWDNFDALREDAIQCGYVVPPSGTAYQDCLLDEAHGIYAYLAGGNPTCLNFRNLNLNSITLNNFSLANYNTRASADRFVRRVIYANSPIEIAQNNRIGLMPGLTNNNARDNLSFWVVNEDVTRIRPYQRNLTPIDPTTPTVRKIYFNQAVLANEEPDPAINSLQLVLLSPEVPQVVTPTYIPINQVTFELNYPMSGGRITQRFPFIFDYTRQENDGYAYGARDLDIVNVALIKSTQSITAPAFSSIEESDYIKPVGMWNTRNHWNMALVYACNFDDPSDAIGYNIESGASPTMNSINPQPPFTRSALPPAGSRFYRVPGVPGDPLNRPQPVPNTLEPELTFRQRAIGYDTSIINLYGHKIDVPFESGHPSGKTRDLSIPKYRYGVRFPLSYGNRRYTWSSTSRFQPVTDELCDNGMNYAGTFTSSYDVIQTGTLLPYYDIAYLNQTSPPIISTPGFSENMSDLGALLYQELPTWSY